MGKGEIFGQTSEYGNGGVILVVWSVTCEGIFRYKYVCHEELCA